MTVSFARHAKKKELLRAGHGEGRMGSRPGVAELGQSVTHFQTAMLASCCGSDDMLGASDGVTRASLCFGDEDKRRETNRRQSGRNEQRATVGLAFPPTSSNRRVQVTRGEKDCVQPMGPGRVRLRFSSAVFKFLIRRELVFECQPGTGTPAAPPRPSRLLDRVRYGL